MEMQDILIQLKEAGIKDQVIADAIGTSRETVCRIRNGKTQDGHTGKSFLESLQVFYNEVNPLQTFQVPRHQTAYATHTSDYHHSYEDYSDNYSNDEEEYTGFRLNMKWVLLIGGIMVLAIIGSMSRKHGVTSEQQPTANISPSQPSQLDTQPSQLDTQPSQLRPRSIKCVNCKNQASRQVFYRWENSIPRYVCDTCAFDARAKGLLSSW